MKKEIFLFIVGVALLASCTFREEKIKPDNKVRVEVKKCVPIQISKEHIYSGTVEEAHGSSLSFSVPGTLQNVYVAEGSFIGKGDLIADLDNKTLHNAYEAAKATLTQAQDAYQRIKQLYENKSTSEIQWVDIQTKYKQAKAAEQIALKNLEDSKLYAPFDGYICQKNVEEGQNVLPGIPVVKLVKIDEVKVKVAVPEDEISMFSVGQSVDMFSAICGKDIFTGRIVETGVSANPLSRSYNVRILVDNKHKKLLPGMICDVYFSTPSGKQSFVLPLSAVRLAADNSTYVWMVENGKAKKRLVQTGNMIKEGVCISQGLKPEDLVIVEGCQKVSEGTEVTIVK